MVTAAFGEKFHGRHVILGATRRFNTEGPVRPNKHYAIAPLTRVDVDDLLGLIQAERYFVLHTPRQTGKTSALLALRDLLNEAGRSSAFTQTSRSGRRCARTWSRRFAPRWTNWRPGRLRPAMGFLTTPSRMFWRNPVPAGR